MSARRQLLGALAVAALVLTACGDDKKSSSSSPATSPAASTAGSSAGSTGAAAGGDCVAQAKAAVEAGKAPLEVMKPPSSIDMKSLAGKSVWMIAAGQTEFTQTVATGFEAAGKAAGINARYVQADFQVNQMQQLVEQAVSAKAAGIVLFNITPETVSGPLAEAIKAGITVVDFNNGDPDDALQDGVFAHVAYEFTKNGQKKAAWMLAETGCKLHLATFTVKTLPVVDKMINGAIGEVNKLCPTDCTVDQNEFNVADFSTALGPQAQTVVRRKPDTNFIDAAADAFASVIAPVFEQAGTKIPIAGHDGNPSTLEAMAAGKTLQAVTIAGPPETFVGWTLVDQLARGMLKLEPANWAIPGRIIDASNIGDGKGEAVHPGWDGYEKNFLTAWGL